MTEPEVATRRRAEAGDQKHAVKETMYNIIYKFNIYMSSLTCPTLGYAAMEEIQRTAELKASAEADKELP